jgi:hypothetical protein
MSAVPSGLSAWAERCIDDPEFWDSAPSWSKDEAVRDLDHHLVGLGPTGLLVLPPPASVLARYFDGESTLAELAEDLAAAADASLDQARWMTAMTTIELHSIGILHGVQAPVPPEATGVVEPDGPTAAETGPGAAVTTVRLDPATGEERLVEQYIDDDGNPVTIEHQADGTRRVTVEHTYQIGQGDQAASDAGRLAEELMGGRRSVAELVPAGTCLGQKLRIDEEPEVVSIRCADGLVRSVRCHDPAVCAVLSERAGDLLAPDGTRGPVEAFVTTPFEGDGPWRVYDGRGERRGRPRTVDDVVDLVDRLLGEATLAGGAADGSGVMLATTLARRGAQALLVHRALETDFRARGELRRAGWDLTGASAVVYEDRTIGTATVFGETGRVPFGDVSPGPILDQLSAPMLLAQVVGSSVAHAAFDDTLDRLVDLVSQVVRPALAGT